MILDKGTQFYAKVIADSVGPTGKRLISVEAKYWRAIHSEIMTHRDRARNAASSRAIPFLRRNSEGVILDNCTYSHIQNQYFIPVFIGSEQKGMQSGAELGGEDRDNAIYLIDKMRKFCLEQCHKLYELGVHKSIINRYLEPWSYITVLMTATEWKNFFRLRIHPKAEKHFNLIASMIKEAIEKSVPKVLKEGEWHLPYIREDDDFSELLELEPEVEIKKKVSAGRCARLSYLTHDGIRDPLEDIKVFRKLIFPEKIDYRDDDVIHSSPLEHVAQAASEMIRSGPFIGWKQFRKEFPNENVEG